MRWCVRASLWLALVVNCYTHAETRPGGGVRMQLGEDRKEAVRYQRTEIRCHQDSIRLKCITGTLIKIWKANYGRTSTGVCRGARSQEVTDCRAPRTLSVLGQKCDGKEECPLNYGNEWQYLLGDPCPGVHKYIQITINCVEKQDFRYQKFACELDSLTLLCDSSKFIRIYKANFGRTDKWVCPWAGADDPGYNCRAHGSLRWVTEKCDGKHECPLNYGDWKWRYIKELGDPCPGVYKYMEIQYHCVDRIRPTSVSQVAPERTRYCQHPWRQHLDHYRRVTYCYLPFIVEKTYKSASNHCLSQNAKLATPHGEASMFPTINSYWIGVEYDHTMGIYAYNDGVPADVAWLSWSVWDRHGGHPTFGKDGQDCTVIVNGQWRSVSCDERHRYICELQACPTDGWTYNPHTDRCNKFFNEKTNFETATKRCASEQAIVEVARSEAADMFLKALVPRTHLSKDRPLWIGMMNLADERKWIWNDGAWVVWTKWKPTPIYEMFRNHKNCMISFAYPNEWTRAFCNMSLDTVYNRDRLQRFVCGKLSCRFPYFTHHGPPPKCYRCMNEATLNARQAGQFCAQDGQMSNPSKLAAPTDPTWRKVLQNKCPGEKWIGLGYNRQNQLMKFNDNSIITLNNHNWNSDVSWDDYTYWTNKGNLCAIMKDDATWILVPCDHKYKFVCEKQAPYALSGCNIPIDQGTLNHIQYHSYYPQVPPAQKMYCFFSRTHNNPEMTYPEAEKFCNREGGHVIMPKTAAQVVRIIGEYDRPRVRRFGNDDYDDNTEEDDDSLKAFPSVISKGGKRSLPNGITSVWIGADKIGNCYNQKEWCTASPRNFVFLDGEHVRYHKFTNGEPNDTNHAEGCITITVRDHTWTDLPCTTLKRHVMCQVEHSYIRAHANWDHITACKDDNMYVAPGDVCYHTMSAGPDGTYRWMAGEIASWGPAYNIARPRTREQMRALVLSKQGTNTAVMGLRSKPDRQDGSHTGRWQWVDIQDKDYGVDVQPGEFNWAPGEPRYGNNTGQCAEFLTNSGKWRAYYCGPNQTRAMSWETPTIASLQSTIYTKTQPIDETGDIDNASGTTMLGFGFTGVIVPIVAMVI